MSDVFFLYAKPSTASFLPENARWDGEKKVMETETSEGGSGRLMDEVRGRTGVGGRKNMMKLRLICLKVGGVGREGGERAEVKGLEVADPRRC